MRRWGHPYYSLIFSNRVDRFPFLGLYQLVIWKTISKISQEIEDLVRIDFSWIKTSDDQRQGFFKIFYSLHPPTYHMDSFFEGFSLCRQERWIFYNYKYFGIPCDLKQSLEIVGVSYFLIGVFGIFEPRSIPNIILTTLSQFGNFCLWLWWIPDNIMWISNSMTSKNSAITNEIRDSSFEFFLFLENQSEGTFPTSIGT